MADTYVNNRGWRWPQNAPIPWLQANYWWNETAGADGTVAPNGESDIACLTNYPFMKQVFRIGDSSPSAAASVEVAELKGFSDKTVYFPTRGSAAYLNHKFTVSNPDGYGGFWDAGDSGVEIVLKASALRTPTLSHVIASNRVALTVADADAAAVVRSVKGGGAIDKKGDGDLAVGSAGGVGTKIYVKGGTLTLEGVAGSTDDPAPGALYHFDASRLDTMTYDVADGRTNVTKWTSLGGTGMYAYRPTNLGGTGSYKIHFANAPFISRAVSPTGLPLMDFGSVTEAGVAEFGPTNCTFGLSYVGTVDNTVSKIGSSKVREVYYAGCRSLPGSASLFGGYDEYNYIAGGYVNSGAHKLRYDESNASKNVLRGEHWLNGNATDNNVTLSGVAETDFHVYGCAATGDTTVRYLTTDQLGPAKMGGWRVGEILIYTNELTRAERNRVNRYLMKKWMGADDADVGAVVVSGGAKVGVADGSTANVRRLAAVNGVLAKTGGGCLEVDHLSPANTAVAIEDGSLALTPAKSPAPLSPTPAPGAYFWIDAESGLVWTNGTNTAGEPVRCVTKWCDRRGDGHGVYAELPEGNAHWHGLPPYVKAGAANGHDVVSFCHPGDNADSYQSWMRMVPSGANASEAFIALRFANRASKCAIFGSTTLDLYSSYWNVLDASYGSPDAPAGAWRLNGAPFDPKEWRIPSAASDEVYVFSVALHDRHAFDLLAKTRTNVDEAQGRVDIGEFIIYDRSLTDAERSETIAYLVEKWRGEKSPDAEGRLRFSSLSYGTGADPSLDAGQDVMVDRIDGVDGRTFLKRGAGTVTVKADRNGTAPSSIVVEGGVLRFELAPDPMGEAVFHFDASDISSLAYYVTDAGARTNVTAWYDSRANGIVAESFINRTAAQPISFTNATMKTVETAGGVWRTVVDFGRRNTNNNDTRYDDAAAMKISGVADGVVRELHVVWADAHAAESGRYADMATSSGNAIDYYRYGAKLIRPDWCTKVANGSLWADGESITAAFEPGTAAHLISAVPTGPTTVTSMFLDRTSNAGGGWYGELVAFSNALAAAEREFLVRRLRAKWFGTPEPVWTNSTALASLEVASGSVLDFTQNVFVRVDSVSGSGEVKAAGVMPGAVSLGYHGTDDVDRIDIEGEISFGSGSAVTVTADSSGVVEPGEWTIISAALISGDVPELAAVNFGRKLVRLRRSGSEIRLVVTKPGMSIVVK